MKRELDEEARRVVDRLVEGPKTLPDEPAVEPDTAPEPDTYPEPEPEPTKPDKPDRNPFRRPKITPGQEPRPKAYGDDVGDAAAYESAESVVDVLVEGNLKFSDGVEFDTRGEPHIETRADGMYVVGHGMLIPVRDEEEARTLIKDMKRDSLPGEDEAGPVSVESPLSRYSDAARVESLIEYSIKTRAQVIGQRYGQVPKKQDKPDKPDKKDKPEPKPESKTEK